VKKKNVFLTYYYLNPVIKDANGNGNSKENGISLTDDYDSSNYLIKDRFSFSKKI